MANVRFIRTTKQKYLNRDSYDQNALYFCTDTNEMFKGQDIYSDGIRVVPTRADLPDCSCAADGVVYYVNNTRNGYTLSPDRTEWIQTIYAPVEDASAVPESEIYNTVTTVGAVRDIEKKIYQRIDEVSSGSLGGLVPVDGTIVITNNANNGKSIGVAIAPIEGNALVAVEGGLFVPVHTAGNGINIVDNEISIKLAGATHGLVSVNGALSINLATRKSDGAMSKEDKLVVDSIPYVYEVRKFDISGTPVGTLVNYGDNEIRVMCPADAEFIKQSVGNNGNPNMYYMTFKAYAPNNAASFKEGDRGAIIDKMYTFEDVAAGTDEFGRKYSVCWLALATYNSTTDTWTYYGQNSTDQKMVGWDYVVEWYSKDGIKIGYDSIRINLSNEKCHYTNKPYYMANYATTNEVATIKESISDISENLAWCEI